MPVDRDELRDAITKVLLKAKLGKDRVTVSYMTAYQVLQKLPKKLLEELEHEHGPKMGRHAGQHFSIATRVAKIAATIPQVQVAWLDTRFLHFQQQTGDDVSAGFGLVGLFRLPEDHPLRK